MFARYVGKTPQAWWVDLEARTGKPLELKELHGGTNAPGPDRPMIEWMGFDSKGQVFALISDIYAERKLKKKGGKRIISFQGKDYTIAAPDVETNPGLALSYRLDGEHWKLAEVKPSHFSYRGEAGPGLGVLSVTKELSPRVSTSIPDTLAGQSAPPEAAQRLKVAFPDKDTQYGSWNAVATPGGTLYAWVTLSDSVESLFPPVIWEEKGKFTELEGLTAQKDSILALQVQGDLLLVTVYEEKTLAQIWDTRTRKRLFSFEDINAPALLPGSVAH